MNEPTLQDIENGLRGNLLTDLLDGWTFRVEEVSSNMYRIDGWDSLAHRVSHFGTRPVAVLQECIRRARRIKEGKDLLSHLRLLVRRVRRGQR
jgi:hypothetical protein